MDIRELQNTKLRTLHWLSYGNGEAYSKRISTISEVYIFREHTYLFTVWRGTWAAGESRPYSQKTIAQLVSFEEAVQRAEAYIKYLKEPGNGRNTSRRRWRQADSLEMR